MARARCLILMAQRMELQEERAVHGRIKFRMLALYIMILGDSTSCDIITRCRSLEHDSLLILPLD